MFGRTKIMKSTGNYSDEIKKLKKAIEEADAVVIGAGAGLSTSTGFTYSGERFEKDRLTIGKAFIEIAKRHDMIIRPCAEGNDLAAYGADCYGCLTVKIFETALNAGLDVPKRSRNQRNNECACLLGTDIGAYDTCGHLCRYCYANANAGLVRVNMKKHNPKSPFLIGNSLPGDVIHEAEQKSWLDMQMRLEI